MTYVRSTGASRRTTARLVEDGVGSDHAGHDSHNGRGDDFEVHGGDEFEVGGLLIDKVD